jgi:hypothetical protein
MEIRNSAGSGIGFGHFANYRFLKSNRSFELHGLWMALYNLLCYRIQMAGILINQKIQCYEE